MFRLNKDIWYDSRYPEFDFDNFASKLYSMKQIAEECESVVREAIGSSNINNRVTNQNVSEYENSLWILQSYIQGSIDDVNDVDESFKTYLHEKPYERLEPIVLENYKTKNTFGVPVEMKYKDNPNSVVTEIGELDIYSILALETDYFEFGDIFRAQYDFALETKGIADSTTYHQYITAFYKLGEYSHSLDNIWMTLFKITPLPHLYGLVTGYYPFTNEKLNNLDKGGSAINVAAFIVGLGVTSIVAEGSGKLILKSLLVDLFAGGTGVLVNEALTELGVPDEFKWIVTISTTLAVGYVGNKYFVFNNKGDIVRMATDDEIAQATKSAKGSGSFDDWLKGMSPEDAARYLTDAGLDYGKVNDILQTNRGYRPDPSTYLDQTYIDNHLKHFDNGVTKIAGTAPTGQAGSPGGTFVMPSDVADDLIRQAGGDVRKLEELLGLDYGSLGNSPIRIDISNPSDLRIPSGNEFGANSQWLPGGFTNGGIPEATIKSPLPGEYVVKPIK